MRVGVYFPMPCENRNVLLTITKVDKKIELTKLFTFFFSKKKMRIFSVKFIGGLKYFTYIWV
jgi:hypothetical protein